MSVIERINSAKTLMSDLVQRIEWMSSRIKGIAPSSNTRHLPLHPYSTMRFSTIAALATLFTSVSAAVYPRQSATFNAACTSYKCPGVYGYDVTRFSGHYDGDGFVCQYVGAPPSDVTGYCSYAVDGVLVVGSKSVDCPLKAVCTSPNGRKRNALPVAAPRAAAPQPLPDSLKMRGQLRRYQE